MAKKSTFSRASKLFGVAAKVATKEAGFRLSKALNSEKAAQLKEKITRIKQAKDIVSGLSQLKGAAMKAGQLLSLESSQFLPDEALDILSELQSLNESSRFEDLQGVLREQLGTDIRKIEYFEEKPIAAASIGQVHRAKYKDRDIVLKIQYSHVKDSIDADLKILKQLAETFIKATGKKMDLEETFSELAEVLKLETDYLHELEILEFFYDKLEGHEFFVVPKPEEDISTEKVLAMEFCNGITLNKWIQSGPESRLKEHLGYRMLDLFMREFLDWGLVQTDPNFGNYLVQADPFRLVLLDFGSIRRYSQEFTSEYLKLLAVAFGEDAEATFEQAVNFGLVDPRESDEVKENFYQMMRVSMEPFFPDKQPFDFASSDYEKRSKKVVRTFTQSLRFSPPPRKILFLHRKLGGIFNLLKRMGVRLDLTKYWEQLI